MHINECKREHWTGINTKMCSNFSRWRGVCESNKPKRKRMYGEWKGCEDKCIYLHCTADGSATLSANTDHSVLNQKRVYWAMKHFGILNILYMSVHASNSRRIKQWDFINKKRREKIHTHTNSVRSERESRRRGKNWRWSKNKRAKIVHTAWAELSNGKCIFIFTFGLCCCCCSCFFFFIYFFPNHNYEYKHTDKCENWNESLLRAQE